MMAVIRKLNYQHLLYFWSVVRTGSLTRACEELALSAPTISAQLRTLEARLGEKLLTKAGRTLVPTEVGRLVYSYADEIFGLGRDLVDALEHRPTRRPLRVVVGIDDVVPKEIAHRLLEPALGLKQPVRLVCHEGTLERLVADLAVHEIDLVLSDAPITPRLTFARTAIIWARARSPGWPHRLSRRRFDGASLSRSIAFRCCCRRTTPPYVEHWINGSTEQNVRPVIVGEFEDYALMREFARAGHGFPGPGRLAEQFRREYGFALVGRRQAWKRSFLRSRWNARSSIRRSPRLFSRAQDIHCAVVWHALMVG